MPSVSDDSVPVYEEDAVDLAKRLEHAASARNAVPKQEVVAAIDGLSQYSSVRGLSKEVLEILIDTLTKAPCHFDQGTSGRIIKALIPRGKVSQEAVLKIVGCLGSGPNKPSFSIQAGLLRWLVMVYNVLEDYTVLSQLYGVLFGLLDMITLRGYICHLLSLLTRRKHIKPFRIQALLQLQRDIGNEQPVNALVHVYKNYYPDAIVGEAARPFKASIFSHPNPEWMQKVLAIQEANAANNSNSQGKSSFKVVRQVGGQSSKRRKTERVVVPEVYTFGATETSVTLEEVQNADDFVKKLDKLDLPSQLAAVLEDRLLQMLLALNPSESSQDRISNWMRTCLQDNLRCSTTATPGASARTGVLLSKISRYTQSTRELLPPVEDFLRNYLQQWDGKSNVREIFELASFLPLQEYEKLYSTFLKPIEKVMRSGSHVSAAILLGFYTALLRNWAVTYGRRSLEKERLDNETQCVMKFVKHVGVLSLSLLGDSADSEILSFYECASSLPWENNLFRVVLPPDQLIYHFLFTGNTMMFSRVCGILVRYKTALELSRRTGGYSGQFVDHFNGFIMDICNCVWRNRAFVLPGPNDAGNKSALGCTIPKYRLPLLIPTFYSFSLIHRTVTDVLETAARDRAQDIKSLFFLSKSPMFTLFSAECFRSIEAEKDVTVKHSGPITSSSLKQLGENGGVKMTYAEYRTTVLDYLKKMGFVGISNFMYATMTSLIPKASEGAQQRQRLVNTRKRKSGMRAAPTPADSSGVVVEKTRNELEP
ncbi:Mis6-domain-containing protein [Wilcoxina mikolae CBS 423.85]|nr:Mis6-domain-containing protein [Wilcoxina mikolae CBS 423.85]